MKDRSRYDALASKWLRGSISSEEKEEFMSWYRSRSNDDLDVPTSFAENEEELQKRLFTKIKASMAKRHGRVVRPVNQRWMLAAGVLVIAILGGLYLFSGHMEERQVTYADHSPVMPGGNRATLVFDNGKKLSLREDQSSVIVGETLHYGDGSALISANDRDAAGMELSYATIQVPKGGQYQIVLHDGTKVWLNAETSLRYPNRFDADRREVQLLHGEAYFEVKHDKSPFYVRNKGQLIEVLGTAFNVNAYENEKGIRTTLVAGSVAIYPSDMMDNPTKTVLLPNQQAHLTADGISLIQVVDTEEFTAWKDGYFHFNEADVFTVMKQIERWYDITVSYDMRGSDDLFMGRIPRSVQLHEVLDILKTAGVNFEWNGPRQLTVLSK